MSNLSTDKIYLDFNASTPVDQRVADVMAESLRSAFGNPSSGHWAGVPARELVERARERVAGLLGCSASEIVFTSGGSESNNLVLKGLFEKHRHSGAHIISTQVEHPAIVEPCRFLERQGARITWLPVDGTGRIDPGDLEKAISSDTILISIMHANNEVGTIQPVKACAEIAHKHGIPVHTDAAQSVGKIKTRVDELGVDLLSIAGHKIYAPKGVGALYVQNGLELEPLIHGAGHESGRRAGTESALLASSLGLACELASDLTHVARIQSLRNRLWESLKEVSGEKLVLNGHASECLPNTLNVSFVGRVGAEILNAIPQIAASTGSACHSGQVELSPVLSAMGVSEDVGRGAIRFSLGRTTTEQEIDQAIRLITDYLNTSGS